MYLHQSNKARAGTAPTAVLTCIHAELSRPNFKLPPSEAPRLTTQKKVVGALMTVASIVDAAWQNYILKGGGAVRSFVMGEFRRLDDVSRRRASPAHTSVLYLSPIDFCGLDSTSTSHAPPRSWVKKYWHHKGSTTYWRRPSSFRMPRGGNLVLFDLHDIRCFQRSPTESSAMSCAREGGDDHACVLHVLSKHALPPLPHG